MSASHIKLRVQKCWRGKFFPCFLNPLVYKILKLYAMKKKKKDMFKCPSYHVNHDKI